MSENMSKALEEIMAERRRQVEVEGWTPDHDADHEPDELLRAAVTYLHHGTEMAAPIGVSGAPVGWPWEPEWFKPRDRRSNLVRAGALCLAEKDAIVLRHKRRLENPPLPNAVPRGFDWRERAPNTIHVDHKLEIIVRELADIVAPEARAAAPSNLSAEDVRDACEASRQPTEVKADREQVIAELCEALEKALKILRGEFDAFGPNEPEARAIREIDGALAKARGAAG